MKKYSEIVKQLESLLELERENMIIKKKVATFSLDYDDDLVNNLPTPALNQKLVSLKFIIFNDNHQSSLCNCSKHFLDLVHMPAQNLVYDF